MYNKENDLQQLPTHVQDTAFLRGLLRDLEASRAPHVPRSDHFTRGAIGILEFSLLIRADFCPCENPEDTDSVREPDSDPEDGSYCGLSHITESDYSFRDAHFATTLRMVLNELQSSQEFVPASIVEGILTRLELEEIQRQKRPDTPRDHRRSPSLSSSLSAGSHTPTRLIRGMDLLPVELICRIISFAQQSDQHIHVSLSQVNRFFRSLVNSSPVFWTKIDLVYPIPLISLYIERSAHSSLEVVADNGVSTVWTRTRERQERTSECLALLRPHRRRIHRLRIRDVDAQFWGLDMRDLSQVPQPRPDPNDNFLWCHLLCNLEVLDLEFADWFINVDLDFPPVTNLRKIRLCGFWSKAHLALLPPQLASLALADCRVDLSELMQALHCTTALENLALSDLFIRNLATRTGTTAVILDRLVNLSLIRCSATVVQAILQIISLPQLFFLTIHFASVPDATEALPTDHVVDVTGVELFTQAQPTIQKLDISAFHANNTFLEDTLQRLPNVIHLRIASASLRDDQLLLLSVGNVNEVPTTRVLCPQLDSLTIENEFDITSGAIRRIAESRHTASIPLKVLTLRGLDGTKVATDDIGGLTAYGITELVVDVFNPECSREDDEDSWSGSEEAETSEGDWLSGDEEVVAGGS